LAGKRRDQNPVEQAGIKLEIVFQSTAVIVLAAAQNDKTSETTKAESLDCSVWGAHASRVLALAPRQCELSRRSFTRTARNHQATWGSPLSRGHDNQHARRVCSPDQILADIHEVSSIHPVRDTPRFFELIRRCRKL
jgi:hypothetical protein